MSQFVLLLLRTEPWAGITLILWFPGGLENDPKYSSYFYPQPNKIIHRLYFLYLNSKLFFSLSVCLFVSNKRQNGWTGWARIFCGTSQDEGSQSKKNFARKSCNNCERFSSVENARNFDMISHWCAKAILRKLWRKSWFLRNSLFLFFVISSYFFKFQETIPGKDKI